MYIIISVQVWQLVSIICMILAFITEKEDLLIPYILFMVRIRSQADLGDTYFLQLKKNIENVLNNGLVAAK